MSKKLFIVISSFFSLLIIFYFWGELSSLSFSKTVNYEKINSFFGVVGSLGTATSLFLLYRQTELMNKANLTFQKPILMIEPNKQYWIPNKTKEDFADADQWNAFMLFQNRRDKMDDPFVVTNNGIGMALNVSYQYNVDVKEFNKFTKQYGLPDLDAGHFLQKNNIGFIKPGEHLEIFSPYFYMYTLLPQVFRLEEAGSKIVWNFPSQLTLSVSYENLQGSLYCKTYELGFRHSRGFPKRNREKTVIHFDDLGSLTINLDEIDSKLFN